MNAKYMYSCRNSYYWCNRYGCKDNFAPCGHIYPFAMSGSKTIIPLKGERSQHNIGCVFPFFCYVRYGLETNFSPLRQNVEERDLSQVFSHCSWPLCSTTVVNHALCSAPVVSHRGWPHFLYEQGEIFTPLLLSFDSSMCQPVFLGYSCWIHSKYLSNKRGCRVVLNTHCR